MAGWQPGGAAQLVYVKEAYKSQLSANGLTIGNAPRLLRNAGLTENFHRIRTPVSHWKERTEGAWDFFRFQVARQIRTIRGEKVLRNGKKLSNQRFFYLLMCRYVEENDLGLLGRGRKSSVIEAVKNRVLASQGLDVVVELTSTFTDWIREHVTEDMMPGESSRSARFDGRRMRRFWLP